MRVDIKSIGFWLVLFCIGIFVISPHILAEQSVFGISEAFLRSFEERRIEEKPGATPGQYEEDRDNLLDYLSPLYRDLDPVKIESNSLFESGYISSISSLTLDSQRGRVVGQFNILPSFMDLTLYDQGNQQDNGVFGFSDFFGSSNIGPDQYRIEAQGTVWDGFSIFYGYDALSEYPHNQGTLSISDGRFIAQNAGLKMNLLPGMLVNANYSKTLGEADLSKAQRSFNVAYNPFSFASFTAGYGVISNNTNPLDASIMPAWLSGSLPNQGKEEPNFDEVVIRQWGMALHPNDYSQLFADYIMTDRGDQLSSSRAVFGLRLGDSSKEINATYQMESQDNHKTTTSAGLELGLVDLASLRAVYSKIEEYQIRDESQKSTLDLGLNLSLAGSSSLELKYKWVLPEDIKPDDERVAEARLVIRF